MRPRVRAVAPCAGTEAALRAVGVRLLFDRVATIEDLDRGQPATGLHLHAPEVLSRDPGGYLALEDSSEGLRATVAVGTHVVDVRRDIVTAVD